MLMAYFYNHFSELLFESKIHYEASSQRVLQYAGAELMLLGA